MTLLFVRAMTPLASYLFKNGQCLGLALALAHHFGTEVVAALEDISMSGGVRQLRHCYALDGEGHYWDIWGPEPAGAIRACGPVRELASADALRELRPQLVEQNMEYAAATISPLLAWAAAMEQIAHPLP